MSAKLLANRVAVVTGSSQGVGRAIALALVDQGAKVVINSRTPADVDKVVAEIRERGGEAVPNYDSVASYEAAGKIIRAAVDSFGRIDILINNAGIRRIGQIYDISEQDWDELLAIHLKGTFNCSQHAALLMKEQGSGRIINVFSTIIFHPAPNRCAYHAAKGGQWALTGAMAWELGPFGVTVNAVSPGFVKTRMTQELVAEYNSGMKTPGLKDSLNPPIEPEEVPPLIVYLCTDVAAGINGQTFQANGKQISWYPLPVAGSAVYTAQDMWTVEELIKVAPAALSRAFKGKGS